MYKRKHWMTIIIAACLVGCGSNAPKGADDIQPAPRTAVTLTHAAYGNLSRELTLSATTAYLDKQVVSAPIAGYLMRGRVQPGQQVGAGTLLYTLESKERHALGGGGADGMVAIRAAQGGVVIDVQQQAGAYVGEGVTLCTIANASSQVFLISVPFEQRALATAGSRCTLVLPDGSRLAAIVQGPLADMDVASQTEQVVARAKAPFLPEGMNVEARFALHTTARGQALVLPRAAVRSDETMTSFWVMKLANDSTATRVPVEVTYAGADEVEIKAGAITPADRIVLSGGYGLEDGARVKIVKP